MVTNETPSVLQAMLARLDASAAAGKAQPAQAARAAQAADPVAARNVDARPATAQAAETRPQVRIPDGATSLDPNARRGTYLNLVV